MTFNHNSAGLALVGLLCLSSSVLLAMQRGWRGGGGYQDRGSRAGVPMWDHDKNFDHDAFRFARVIYRSDGGRYGRGRGGGWDTDYPDADLNFSLRLRQLTSIKVNPDPIQLELTDPRIFDYPFLYMIEVGRMSLSEVEIAAMRKYCLNGGFIMVDDFWGDGALLNMRHYAKLAFPEREPEEVPLDHQIFQCVYPLEEKPQIPSIHSWQGPGGDTYEWGHDYGQFGSAPHYMAIYDDARRIMMFICHNTDLGDGWEREGENADYFQEVAVKKSYPLGINIVTYAMTH